MFSRRIWNLRGQPLTDKNAVKDTLDSFSYQDQMTDPYSGIESVLTFLDGIPRKSGDIIHLILITDGVPDFDNAEGEVKEEKLAKSAAKRILHSPEILVSTLCTGKWNGIAEKTFKKGKGVHSVISNTEQAKSAGKKVTSYIDKLYRLKIKLKASPVKDRMSCRVNLMGTTSDGQMANFEVELTFKDGMIYVEDMNSASGTAIGGMKIQGLNRLRSGDVLSIGEVEFCLKF